MAGSRNQTRIDYLTKEIERLQNTAAQYGDLGGSIGRQMEGMQRELANHQGYNFDHPEGFKTHQPQRSYPTLPQSTVPVSPSRRGQAHLTWTIVLADAEYDAVVACLTVAARDSAIQAEFPGIENLREKIRTQSRSSGG